MTSPPSEILASRSTAAVRIDTLQTVTGQTALSPLRVVIDSNVWIDILVFDDPLTRPIRDALRRGAIDAVIDAACFYEIEHVLDYPQFARFDIDKSAALAALRHSTRWIQIHDEADEGAVRHVNDAFARPSNDRIAGTESAMRRQGVPMPAVSGLPLPRCRDRDDQKFLELAARANAAWLVTKDKALLKLSRRMQRDFGCHVARPVVFTDSVFASATPLSALTAPPPPGGRL